jgi:hypothetical protein
VSLDLILLLAIAILGIWRLHVERRREDAELAVKRGRGNLGKAKP